MLAIDLARFDVFVFDLDGVVTNTAVAHAAAWKRSFDELLVRLANGASWEPFDIEHDYHAHVDGKPRRDGIRSSLNARRILLPEGSGSDALDADTVYGLAARKNKYFLDKLAANGVDVYQDTAALILTARHRGIKTAVVSASENCAAILVAARMTELFDARVDGVDTARLGLRGKPAPDTFLEAARRLDASPRRCVVFEDAIAGVQGGRAGNFGLVVGVDRFDHAEALRIGGADVVVTALDQIELTLDTVQPELR